MSRYLAFIGASFAAGMLGAAFSSPALADLQVIESNVAAYKIGTMLPDNTLFNLDTGDRVQVLVLPSKQTRVFEGKGPHSVAEPRGGSRSPTAKKKQPEPTGN
jgi:hypothetical protein